MKLLNQIKFSGFRKDWPHDETVWKLSLEEIGTKDVLASEIDLEKTYENYASAIVDWVNIRLETNIKFNGLYDNPANSVADIFVIIDPEDSGKLTSSTLRRNMVGHYELIEDDRNMEDLKAWLVSEKKEIVALKEQGL